MRNHLATETLKTGETLEVECVQAPDAERAAQLRPFLAHKPPNYKTHIEAALEDRCDGLETRFYVGLLDGEIVGTIMTSESGGVGIFGHVRTREDQRRKGICSAIMRHQMEDFRQRDGHVLLLGTGYQSAAYWIYHSYGFRDWEIGRPGLMRYSAEEGTAFEERRFAPAPCRPATAGWKHWPLVSLMASLPAVPTLRSLTFDIRGVSLLEGPYVKFFHDYGGNERAWMGVLESEKTGAVMAAATVVPDARWRGDALLLDLFAHPNANPADLVALLRANPLREENTQCFADPSDAQKIAALEEAGFRRVATLPKQFRAGDSWQDVWLYARHGEAV